MGLAAANPMDGRCEPVSYSSLSLYLHFEVYFIIQQFLAFCYYSRLGEMNFDVICIDKICVIN